MPKFLVRRPLLVKSNIQVGTNGTTASLMQWGTVDITCPSADASSIGVRTASISNLAGGADLFLTPGSVPQGFVLASACANANGGEFSASFLNVTTADISTSAIVTLQYLAIS